MSSRRESSPYRWAHWLIIAVAFVALYAWMTRGNASPLVGKEAPDVTLPVAAGGHAGGPTELRLSELTGQVVVLDFWASWCQACRRSTPILNDLYEELGDRGAAFYGVNVERIDRARLQAAHAAFGTEFPTVQDRSGVVQRRYAIDMLPTVIVVGRDGLVRWASTGVPSKTRLRSAISEALD
ncbi:MAG: TlpA disulfide reductase family protein [Myxococcales bacterium]|jgi:thiol-disulfide isomerase/thioredoxin